MTIILIVIITIILPILSATVLLLFMSWSWPLALDQVPAAGTRITAVLLVAVVGSIIMVVAVLL